MSDNTRYTCTVLFVGDYFALQTTVSVDSEDMPEGADVGDTAMALAGNVLFHHYGWDVTGVSHEIEVVDVDKYAHN